MIRRFTRASTRFLTLLTTLVAVSGLSALSAFSALAAPEPLVDYPLNEGLVATVNTDGGITIAVDDGTERIPLLVCTWPWADDPREKTAPELFVTRTHEGDVNGERGFNPDADDDGDGLVDEDRLDGRDNDGDGLLDEDYAAISHNMTVWNLSRGDRSRHLEALHWSYPHLAGFLAAVYTANDDAVGEPLNLTVFDGTWVQADEFCYRTHELAPGPIFLASVADPRRSGRSLWLGVALLDAQPRRRSPERVRATSATLSVPLLAENHGAYTRNQTLAIAAGPTRLRVMHDLAAANRLRNGVEDPVSRQRVAWLPAPLTPVTTTDLPAVTLRSGDRDGFDLLLEYGPGQSLRFDPDLFRLAGQPLGQAVMLVWTPQGGQASELSWPPDARDFVDACHPYDQLSVAGAGQLKIHFDEPFPVVEYTLEGTLVDGRRPELGAVFSVDTPGATDENEPRDELDNSRLQLSPLLLSNYPNPFRSSTRISYQIPTSMGDAFQWDEEGEPPFDPRRRMSYADGGASTTVTIYSLEGREIAVLFTGILGSGTYQVQWDGRDRLGRTMASGAYFCKLQIENWAVTKRLIFVR